VHKHDWKLVGRDKSNYVAIEYDAAICYGLEYECSKCKERTVVGASINFSSGTPSEYLPKWSLWK